MLVRISTPGTNTLRLIKTVNLLSLQRSNLRKLVLQPPLHDCSVVPPPQGGGCQEGFIPQTRDHDLIAGMSVPASIRS